MRLLTILASLTAACGSTPPASSPANRVTVPGEPMAAPPVNANSPYEAATWIKKLSDPRESDRAVTELEQLGDSSAIGPLGQAWLDQGRPVRYLQVIISLARPYTADEAKARYLTNYEATGRLASWDQALPYLVRALTEVDVTNPRSVDSATKAADALGEAALPGGLDALIAFASRPVSKYTIAAQVAAIRALGRFTTEKPRAGGALITIIGRVPPRHPKTAADKAEGRALETGFGLFLGITGASINAVGELRDPAAVQPLLVSLYRTPELFMQIRRALVASGPTARDELRTILRGESAAINQLFSAERLGLYCGDQGDLPPDRCEPVSAKDFYAAVVLGDFYDPASVPDLLAVLNRFALPVYFMDDQPSPHTQYNAVFDALRKIGAPAAADPVRAMWSGKRGTSLETRVLAISTYAFVSRDATGTAELGTIVADRKADDSLRQEAATALARVSRDAEDIKILLGLAQKYLDASAARAKEAASKQKEADAADQVFAAQTAALEKAKADLLAITQDASKTADEISAATSATRQAEQTYRLAKAKHKEQTASYKTLTVASKAFLGYARMFQTHVARIEIALRCKDEMPCYAASLRMTPDEAARTSAKYLADVDAWTLDEKRGLVEAAIDRAMLEIGKQGAQASNFTDPLLDAAISDDRMIRQAILLALPKIAKLPCATCEPKLERAIKAGEGKPALGDLTLETTLLRNYFAWAGRKTPPP